MTHAIKNEVLFLGFCVEIYKTEKKMSGQDAFNYLYRTGATGFIERCYEGLHTTGHLHVIDSIDDYIKTHDGVEKSAAARVSAWCGEGGVNEASRGQ